MSTFSTKRARFRPFRFAEGALGLHLESYRLDDGEPTTPPDEERTIHVGDTWRSITLSLLYTVESDLLARVLPDEERPPRAVLVASCRCPSTYLLRQTTIAIADAPNIPRTHEVVLSADDVAGHFTLDLDLVRTDSIRSGSGPRFAPSRGMGLASALPWTLQLRAPEEQQGRYLDTRFASFSEDPQVPDELSRGYFYLQQGDPPHLLLNSDYPSFERALKSRGTRGADARVRDVALGQLQEQIWPALIVEVLTELQDFGESTQSWQEGVLAQWLPVLYPTVSNPEEQRERALQELRDRPYELMTSLRECLHARSKAGEIYEKLLTEVS